MSPKTNTSSEYQPRHYESSQGKYGEESLIMDGSLSRMSSCESCSSSYGDLQTTLNAQCSDAHELSSHGENGFSTLKTDKKQRDFNAKPSHDGSNEGGSGHQISSGNFLSSSSLESTEEDNKQSNDLLDDSQSKISSLVLNNIENHMDGDILAWLPDFESDPCIWVPPEPENMEDDKPSIADNYEDDEYSGSEWKQASSLSSLDEHHGFIQTSREKRQKAMLDAMNGQFKILVSRFLASEGVTFSVLDDDKSWVDIVASLSWKAALLVKPDATEGRAMDPGAYVKVKCIASGTPQQSELINGLVFKKNAAHKHMQTKFRNAKLLLLQGILGHSAVGLSSFNSMEQEKDYLKSMTEMIEACHPNVVLVEKNISRDIQESLIEKGITVVSDMKHQRLTRISLCTGSPIISCSDFPSNLILPQCDFFHIERFVEEYNSANEGGKKPSKTLMYLEGFRKPLGYTILLKGAESDDLKKIKRVVQYTVFAAYHLILETLFFADQRVFFTDNNAARRESGNFNNEPFHFIRSDATGYLDNHEGCLSLIASEQSVDVPICSGSFGSFTDVVTSSDSHLGYTISENSGIVDTNVLDSFQSRNLLSLFSPRREDNSTTPNFESGSVEFVIQNTVSDGKRTDHDVSENSEIKEEKLGDGALDYKDNGIIGDSIVVNNDAHISKQQNDDIESVLDSQSILVLLSKQCTTKATICDQSHLSRIKYYGYFDISLGRFLKDLLLDKNSCTSCGEPPEAHVFCYTHQNGNLSVYVKKISPDSHLPGESEGKIWMWTRCLRCKNGSEISTRRVPLSSSAHSLSFGKFLELSFSGHSAASRLSECGHSLHRDFLRFFGLGSKVAMFVYSSVKIYAACKPPPVLEFHDPKGQEWFKKEMEDVLFRGHKFFSEVSDLLQNLKSRYIDPHARQCAKISGSLKEYAEVEEMLIKEKTEFEAFLLKAIDNNGQVDISTYEVLDLKWLNQELLLELYIWDSRLNCLFQDMKCQKESVVVVDEVSRAPSHEDETTYCADNTQIDVDVQSTKICVETIDSSNTLLDIGLADLEQPAGMLSVKSWNDELVTSVLELEQRSGYLPSAPRENNKTQEVCASISSDIQNHSVQTVEDPFVDRTTDELKNDEAVTKSSVNDNSSVYAKSEGPEDLIWAPFSDLKREYRNDLNDGSFRKFKFMNTYIPSHLSPLHRPSETDSLYFPVGPGGNVLSVSQDEISSIIACALSASEDHPTLPENEPMELHKSYSLTSESSGISTHWSSMGLSETEGINMSHSISSLSLDESFTSISDGSISVDHMPASDNLHPQVSVGMDKVSGRSIFSVACIYAKQFYTLRKKCCPSELAYISSLGRCKKWDAQGGKSKAFFAKTLDDRLIIKQIKKAELDSFLKFGPDYFKHVFHSLDLGSQTCLAKILGVYQVRQTKNGKEIKTDLMVMENLLFGHKVSRTYDLKGASFARYVADAKYSKTVLLDQNFVEDMCKSPIYLGGKTKHLLQRAIWNDTSFLTSINVMDYSLLVGVDDERGELVFGIIDYLRQYTWDKQLETWVKASMVVPKNELPTIISPKEYKKRFRKFMAKYFLAVPHSWNCEHCSPTCIFCVDGKKSYAKVHNTELAEQ
ncbi:putative 1-phosphatidylinositol-3-phosphate 5-kinase FAB1D isoform X1 [Zingiber officinale]|nr:putative 1-phosphatidylinositol-3-phosphate 5-kinase FAB1D isoform X1 [Zingiber officinale]XP_042444464.1 putative 1-phosphatidylinositol-3-phosphate 5-kinase FAB1D isoform X1 [Zingiber officinale]XP_042444465.1 putative 1-phosphatidylinositol-3-phosphate 5-kinase FAB1D isoform X1 [Zingiber officinale]XP_042444466.1 putative 1-phosphatidylinositol-3-phosphate 5-kinase FAB1D isoform X1 [Zingiber officinale]